MAGRLGVDAERIGGATMSYSIQLANYIAANELPLVSIHLRLMIAVKMSCQNITRSRMRYRAPGLCSNA